MNYRMQIYMKHNDTWIDHSNPCSNVDDIVAECERWRKNHPTLQFRIITEETKETKE